MKGDFSRIRFTPGEHFTSVLEQQGRVSLDADANEQRAIDSYLRETEAVDVIGEYGAPVNDAGFGITLDQNEILIGAGRYYVQGLLCENSQNNLPYSSQQYLVDPWPSDAMLLSELAQQGGSAVIQVFLQVWQRLVTALDDPCLLEPALNQADTTARLQTVWRVMANLVLPTGTITQNLGGGEGIQQFTLGTFRGGKAILNRAGSAVAQQFAKAAPATSAAAAGKRAELSHLSVAPSQFLGTAAGEINSAGFGNVQSPPPDCCVQMYAQTSTASTGTMSAVTNSGSSDCSCQPIPPAGYQGLENQLYRVEIHQGGDETIATFKWSRENGSIVSAITSFSGSNGQTVFVDSLGKDANLGFAANQWVEISDDSYEFGEIPNYFGQLCLISSVSPAGQPPSITFTSTVPSVDPTKNARVRRWDQPGTGTAGDMPLNAGTAIDLENGIQITFTAGSYQSGDYWLIPARTASGTIDWPPCGGNGNLFQSPHSIEVYNAPLACIHWNATTGQANVEDCRRFFSPLTALPSASQSIHVANYSWQNDDITTFDLLLQNGLSITFDQAPVGPITGAEFRVTLEALMLSLIGESGQNQDIARLAARANASSQAAGADVSKAAATFTTTAQSSLNTVFTGLLQTLPLGVAIFDWQISGVGTTTITWQLPSTDLTGAQAYYIQLINQNLIGNLSQVWAGIYARMRVRLSGSAIFGQSGSNQLFLDGQSFGTPSTRADGVTPCIALQMPSGNGAKASDFEGWFYVAPFNGVGSVGTNYPAYTVTLSVFGFVNGVEAGNPLVPVTAQATVYLNYPAAMASGATVDLSVTSTTAGVTASNYVSVPATLNIPQGSSQGTVNISVFGNPGASTTYTFQITATVPLAYGTPIPQTTTFTLTGVQGGTIGIGFGQGFNPIEKKE